MGVVIQEAVGRRFGDRFYPHVSGVAQSRNFYPIGSQQPEDGIVLAALGLGHQVVGGGTALRFSPGAPEVLPQFPTVQHLLRGTQTRFWALDLSRPRVDFLSGRCETNLCEHGLDVAEADGTLAPVGSVYRVEDGVLRDSLREPGPRVVSFRNVLQWGALPLAPALRDLLQVVRQGLGAEADVELALDLGTGGEAVRAEEAAGPTLYVLQLRPMARQASLERQLPLAKSVPRERLLLRASRALGHGVLTGIRDVVYVTERAPHGGVTPAIAREVGEMNHALREAPYLLIGPGRWGTSDPRMGIPVEWAQIAGARVIVETPLEEGAVAPSQGTHFFHNITSKQIGYLTLDGGEADYLDEAFLRAQPAVRETAAVRHVRFELPLLAVLDGRAGTATVLKPGAEGWDALS
jgi:hypothetical protein